MLTLPELKTHLRIEQDFIEEDEYLQSLINASILAFERDTARKVYASVVPDDDETGVLFDETIKQALKLLCASWYNNREAVANVATSEVPISYWHIAQRFRLYGI